MQVTADAGEDVNKEEHSSIGGPVFHPIGDCEHPLLYLPGTGIASQETAISTKSCWHMRWCLHLEADYGMDPRVRQSLDGPSFLLSSKLYLFTYFHGCFVPNTKKGQSVYTLVFVLLEFHVLCILYLGYSKFLG